MEREPVRSHWLEYQLATHGIEGDPRQLASCGFQVYHVHEMDGAPEPATAEHFDSAPDDRFIALPQEIAPDLHPIMVESVDMDRHTMYMVPMPLMPSSTPAHGLEFLVSSTPCYRVSPQVCAFIQQKMKEWKTEALTDGKGNFFTIAGNALVACDPLIF